MQRQERKEWRNSAFYGISSDEYEEDEKQEESLVKVTKTIPSR